MLCTHVLSLLTNTSTYSYMNRVATDLHVITVVFMFPCLGRNEQELVRNPFPG